MKNEIKDIISLIVIFFIFLAIYKFVSIEVAILAALSMIINSILKQ